MALGNLGIIGSHSFSDNPEKLQQFVENFIELSQESKQSNLDAFLRLGDILSSKGDYEESTKQYLKAWKDKSIKKEQKEDAFINYGMTSGKMNWSKKQKELQEQIKEGYIEDESEDDDPRQSIPALDELYKIR